MLPFDRDGTTSVFSPSFSLWETSLRFRLRCLWFRMNAMCTLFPFANTIEKGEGWKNWSTTTRHVHSRVGKRIRIYWSDFTRPDRREGTKERQRREERRGEQKVSGVSDTLLCGKMYVARSRRRKTWRRGPSSCEGISRRPRGIHGGEKLEKEPL